MIGSRPGGAGGRGSGQRQARGARGGAVLGHRPRSRAYRRHGLDAAREYARAQRGRSFDPALADLFIAEADQLAADIDAASSFWEDVIGAEPSLGRFVGGDELDATLEAMADLVDMQSPSMAGHSRGVANLALEAGRISGADDELSALRRASAGSASPTRSGTSRGR